MPVSFKNFIYDNISINEKFDIIETMVNELSEINNVSPDIIWDDLEEDDDIE